MDDDVSTPKNININRQEKQAFQYATTDYDDKIFRKVKRLEDEEILDQSKRAIAADN